MYARYALALAVILGSVAPAFAAKGFYIVRGPLAFVGLSRAFS